MVEDDVMSECEAARLKEQALSRLLESLWIYVVITIALWMICLWCT